MIKKEIIVNSTKHETRVGVLEDKRLVEFYFEREKKSPVGRIYKGRVENVVPGLSGAFVSIGLEKNGFLPLSDIPQEAMAVIQESDIKAEKPKKLELTPGQEILVQVVKEPVGQKGARLSSYIFLPGRYLVLMPNFNHVGVSRRIKDIKERKRLRKIVHSLDRHKMGLIVRTAAEKAKPEAIRADFKHLITLWHEIEERAKNLTAPSLIYEEPPVTIKLIRDMFNSTVSNVVVDSPQEYEKILSYLREFAPRLRSRVKLYSEETPIFEAYGVEDQIKDIFKRKIWLPSGGFITIDHTEALVAIDVNTGRYAKEENQEKLVYKTNIEAAKEIARQIRLRDLSGLIVIDFIDLKNRESMESVVRELQKHLKEDRAQIDFARISRFGLLEMTRERKRVDLFIQLTEECRVCRKKGRVPSKVFLLSAIERFLENSKDILKGKEILIKAEPSFADYLSVEKHKELEEWVMEYEISVFIKDDVYLAPGEVMLIDRESSKILWKSF